MCRCVDYERIPVACSGYKVTSLDFLTWLSSIPTYPSLSLEATMLRGPSNDYANIEATKSIDIRISEPFKATAPSP